jgi:hypothetical protein
MIKLPRKLAFLAVPAVLALGGATYASVVAFAAANPSPTPAAASEKAEPSETAPEKAEPNEPALPGGGYADADNVQADTQQEGIH